MLTRKYKYYSLINVNSEICICVSDDVSVIPDFEVCGTSMLSCQRRGTFPCCPLFRNVFRSREIPFPYFPNPTCRCHWHTPSFFYPIKEYKRKLNTISHACFCREQWNVVPNYIYIYYKIYSTIWVFMIALLHFAGLYVTMLKHLTPIIFYFSKAIIFTSDVFEIVQTVTRHSIESDIMQTLHVNLVW